MRKLRTTIVLLAFGMAACSSGDPGSAEKPSPSPEPPVTTTVPEVTTTTVPEPVQVEQAPATTEPEHVHPPVTARTRTTVTTVYEPPAPQSRTTRGGGSPAGGVLACIRSYEQGEDGYATDTGNGYSGAYQFDRQTWSSVGGTGNPADASPAEQDARAWALYESRGLAPWPTPARLCS